jgi:purine-binding chemotaxis protein CheW
MAAPETNLVVFELQGTRYGVAAELVNEVVAALAPTPLSGAPDMVDGVFSLRGTIIPVLNIRKIFGLAERRITPDQCFLIARVKGTLAALRVDQVDEIIAIESERIERAKLVVGDAARVSGVVRMADGLILIHDLETLLTGAELSAIHKAIAQHASAAPEARQAP